jgi:hypothetical protein
MEKKPASRRLFLTLILLAHDVCVAGEVIQIPAHGRNNANRASSAEIAQILPVFPILLTG